MSGNSISLEDLEEANLKHFQIWTGARLDLAHQLFADDIVYFDLAPNITLQGLAELETRLQEEFELVTIDRLEARNVRSRLLGNVGLNAGEYFYSGQDDQGSPFDGKGFFLEVYEKGSDGTVRLVNYLSAAAPEEGAG